MEYLRYLQQKSKGVLFKGYTIVICQPESSSFNKLIRDKLIELNVYFKESN